MVNSIKNTVPGIVPVGVDKFSEVIIQVSL